MNHSATPFKVQLIKDSPIPLYRQILNLFRAQIASGEFSVGMRLPTEAELETEWGVSRVTIRQALSAGVDEGWLVRMPGKGTFIANTTQGKAPAGTSQAPVNQRAVSCIVHHLSSAFNVQTLLGVESVLKAEGYHLIFGNSEGDLNNENELLQRFHADEMAGHIVWPVSSASTERTLLILAAKNTPIVLVDRIVPGIHTDAVMTDHFEGGKVVVNHLIEQGYRDIVYLSRQAMEISSLAERYAGYQSAMRAAGLMPQPPRVIGEPHEMGHSPDIGGILQREAAAITEIRAYIESPARSAAIVASNDLSALLVYEAARLAGVRIPGDLALVGFDNLDFTMQLNLTTMQQQAHQVGVEAARLLLRRIRGECEGPLEIRVPARLIIRGSSVHPPG